MQSPARVLAGAGFFVGLQRPGSTGRIKRGALGAGRDGGPGREFSAGVRWIT
jgi:hypothetical protein